MKADGRGEYALVRWHKTNSLPPQGPAGPGCGLPGPTKSVLPKDPCAHPLQHPIKGDPQGDLEPLGTLWRPSGKGVPQGQASSCQTRCRHTLPVPGLPWVSGFNLLESDTGASSAFGDHTGWDDSVSAVEKPAQGHCWWVLGLSVRLTASPKSRVPGLLLPSRACECRCELAVVPVHFYSRTPPILAFLSKSRQT